MHASSSLLTSSSVLLLAIAINGCAPTAEAPSAPDEPAAATSEGELSSGGGECVLDTITLKKGFLTDLAAAVDTSMIKDYGAQFYKHVEIPKTLDAALSTDEYGEWVYTFHGFDFHPEELVPGSTATPRFVATVGGGSGDLVDPKLSFAKNRYAAAKALFDAMTRAPETKVDHVVPASHVYDRSWTKWTRRSPAGRVTCEKTLFAGTTTPDYSCTFFDVDRTMVQTFNTKDTKCPTK